jgi:hypothetical protein
MAAVSKLLGFLSPHGATVTTDALDSQRDVARMILERDGDYALALNGHHRTLQADVARCSWNSLKPNLAQSIRIRGRK